LASLKRAVSVVFSGHNRSVAGRLNSGVRPVMKRAVYKQEVIDKWTVLVSRQDRTYGRYAIVSATAALIGLAAALLFKPIFIGLFFLGFTGVILLAHAGTSRFKCPNC